MLLQVAFDFLPEDQILSTVKNIRDSVDIIEIGTVALLQYGKAIIPKIRDIAPDVTLLADAKVADAGYLESELLFDVGADIVTVLGAMSEITIASAVDCARERNKEIMVDLIGISDYSAVASKINACNPDYVCSHLAVDIVSKDRLQMQFKALKNCGIQAKLALAGAVTLDNIDEMIALGPDVVIVGRGITAVEDKAATAAKLKEKIDAAH